MPLTVSIVTPEREVEVCDDATLVIAKGTEGDIGIMPGHAPVLIALKPVPSQLILQRENTRDEIWVDGGFMQVKDDSLIVLAEYAVLPAELDPAAVEAEANELRARLQAEAESDELKRQLQRREGLLKLLQVG